MELFPRKFLIQVNYKECTTKIDFHEDWLASSEKMNKNE